MFTQLFDRFVSGVGTMPGFMVYGIAALWVGAENLGIPLPLELMLLFSGSLIALGQLNVGLVLCTVMLAGVAFSALAYLIGRQAGASGVLRIGRYIGLSQQRIDHIDAWLRERGAVGVVFARIVPGIRLFGSYVMGVAGIPPRTFAVGVAIGTVVYFSIWVVIGAVLGPGYRVPLRYLDRLGLYGFALIVVSIAAIFVVHHLWGRLNLRRLAAGHALRLESLAAAGNVSPVAATAGVDIQASGPAVLALQSSHEPPMAAHTSNTVGMSRRWTQVFSSPQDRLPELYVTRRAMRSAAARPWPTWVAWTVAAGWLVVLALFVMLAVAAHQSPSFPVDLSISGALRPLYSTPLGHLITFVGDQQGPVGASIAYLLIFGVLVVGRFFLEAICLAISGLGAEVGNIVVNAIVARPRPAGDVSHTLANLGAHSFPSGHTADCVGLYGFVFFLAALANSVQPAHSRWRPWLIAAQVVSVIFILNVGVSRVIEGQHWPSDVVGGYLLGSLFLVIGISLYHVLAQREAGIAKHGALALATSRIEMLGRDIGTLDHRIAEDVGLRGPDLQAQVRAPWPSWTIALVAALWVEVATITLLLAVSAHRYATFPIDTSLAATVQQLRGTLWARLIYPAGDLQWYLPTAIAYVIIFGTLLVLRLYLAAIFTAISSFGTDLVNVFINAMVSRPRPHGVRITTLTGGALGSASFPSGHVAHTVGLYGFVFFLCILAMRAQPRLKPWLIAIQAVCLYFILFVGVSRVLEGQHWPSDVIGGYLVGLSVLSLAIVLYHVVAMRGDMRHSAIPSPVVEPGVEAVVTDP